MTRTLSVAGTLAILFLTLWIGQLAKGTTTAVGSRTQAIGGLAVAAPPSTDMATAALDDLAAWPIAASH